MDDHIDDAQAGAERLALVVSAYYNQLVRENVPPDGALQLAYRYQTDLMAIAAETARSQQRTSTDKG